MYRETSEKWYRENGSCPICESLCYENRDVTPETIISQPIMIVCPICGKFRFSTGAKSFFDDARAKQLGYKLSFYLRSISEGGAESGITRCSRYTPMTT